MAINKIVNTNFWNDDKVVDMFSPEDKLFFLYLLTNPHTSLLGIYKINKKIMAFELGYSIDTISTLIDRFENKYEMIKYSNETQEIAIRNYLKYSVIKGGKPVEDCLIKEINQVKDKSLLEYIYINIKNYSNLNETINNIINNNIYNNINNNNYNYNYNNKDTSTYRKRIVAHTEESLDLFNKFWCAYPKKRDKGRVEKWFNAHCVTQELVEKMVAQIERLKDTEQWKKDNGKFIPYPATWLNAKGWEDEFETDTEREERIDREILEGTYGT